MSREREERYIYPDTVTAPSTASKCTGIIRLTLIYDEQLVRNILDRLFLILIITHRYVTWAWAASCVDLNKNALSDA